MPYIEYPECGKIIAGSVGEIISDDGREKKTELLLSDGTDCFI